MCEIQSENIKVIDGIEYINYEEFHSILKVFRSRYGRKKDNNEIKRAICSDFKITMINTSTKWSDKEEFQYFKLKDVYNALREAKTYYNQYYLPDELFKLVGSYAFPYPVRNPPIEPSIETPEKYKRVLYKEGKLFDRNDVESFLNDLLSKGIDYVKRNSESKYKNGEEYLPVNTVIDILGIKNNIRFAFRTLVKDWNVSTIKIDIFYYYNASDIQYVKQEITSFYEQHYVYYEVMKLVPRKKWNRLRKIAETIRINGKYTKFFQDTYNKWESLIAFKKADIDGFLEKTNAFLDDFNSNYLSIEEAAKVLAISKKRFYKYRDEYKIEKVVLPKTPVGYSKKSVYELLDKRQEYYKEYIISKECGTYFNNKSTKLYYLERLTKYKPPLYATYGHMCQSGDKNTFVYKKEEFFQALEEYKKKQSLLSIGNIYIETPYDTFLARLNAYVGWDDFDEQSVYTRKKWFDYIEGILKGTKRSEKGINGLINLCIYTTVEFKSYFLDLARKKEIYLLTTQEVNMGLRVVTSYTYTKHIYGFIKRVFLDIQATGEAGNKNFRIDKIKKAEELWIAKERKGANEIYSFDIYSKIFDYCTNVKYHTQKALEEMNSKGKSIYASTWLYVILHLNNAWRHGDVKCFPKLPISDILERYNIHNISWFETNEVTITIARAIVYSVLQWEFKISKTQMKGTFFCSDELAPAFATAVILLTLHINLKCIQKEDVLMSFETKFNDVPSKALNTFFKRIDLENFKFGSIKFNKTIMTYIYYIANLSGDSKALLYAMKLRGHVNSNTTIKHYVQLDTKMVEELGKQLFARGEFGYVASLLAQRLSRGQLSFSDVTNEVTLLNESFGDLVKVNTTIGFMNLLRAERKQVFDAIEQMTFQQIQEVTTNMYARKMPSKDSTDTQCLFKECKRPDLHEKDGCFECQYHIPSIYALDKLCENIKNDIIMIDKTNIIPEKFKLALAIEKKKFNIIEAIKKYGKDYVYECLGHTREEFLSMMAYVPKSHEIISIHLSK